MGFFSKIMAGVGESEGLKSLGSDLARIREDRDRKDIEQGRYDRNFINSQALKNAGRGSLDLTGVTEGLKASITNEYNAYTNTLNTEANNWISGGATYMPTFQGNTQFNPDSLRKWRLKGDTLVNKLIRQSNSAMGDEKELLLQQVANLKELQAESIEYEVKGGGRNTTRAELDLITSSQTDHLSVDDTILMLNKGVSQGLMTQQGSNAFLMSEGLRQLGTGSFGSMMAVRKYAQRLSKSSKELFIERAETTFANRTAGDLSSAADALIRSATSQSALYSGSETFEKSSVGLELYEIDAFEAGLTLIENKSDELMSSVMNAHGQNMIQIQGRLQSDFNSQADLNFRQELSINSGGNALTGAINEGAVKAARAKYPQRDLASFKKDAAQMLKTNGSSLMELTRDALIDKAGKDQMKIPQAVVATSLQQMNYGTTFETIQKGITSSNVLTVKEKNEALRLFRDIDPDLMNLLNASGAGFDEAAEQAIGEAYGIKITDRENDVINSIYGAAKKYMAQGVPVSEIMPMISTDLTSEEQGGRIAPGAGRRIQEILHRKLLGQVDESQSVGLSASSAGIVTPQSGDIGPGSRPEDTKARSYRQGVARSFFDEDRLPKKGSIRGQVRSRELSGNAETDKTFK